jgi:hypothetical protein
MTDASGGDDARPDLDDDDLDDEDDGWSRGGWRERVFGDPPLWLFLVAAVLLGLGVLNGIASWKLYGGFSCSDDGFGDDRCDLERWEQLQAFLSGASIYVLAATAALIGHAFVVERSSARAGS